MNERCEQVQTLLTKKGVRSCIFKGQENLPFYSSELSSLPQSGDIDIWIEGGKERVIELVQKLAPTKEMRETHAHLDVFEDAWGEAHYRPGLLRNFVTNARLQRFFAEMSEECFTHKERIPNEDGKHEIVTTAWTFNAVHQLTHIFHHFFTEGVGLRRCMDYYMLLQTAGGESDKNVEIVKKEVTSLNMTCFARR